MIAHPYGYVWHPNYFGLGLILAYGTLLFIVCMVLDRHLRKKP